MSKSVTKNNFFIYVVIILSVVSIFLMVRPLSLVAQRIPLEYNEGWNAYLADSALGGQISSQLYPSKFSTVTNNYPPLSFIIVGYFGRIFGDNIISGRIINIISIILISALIFIIVFKSTNFFYGSIISSLSFFIYSSTVFWRYFAIDDPQWLANGIMLLGFSLCLYGEDKKKFVIFSAFLMVFSGFIKHNLVSLPVSTLIYLYFRDKKTFSIFVISALSTFALLIGFSYEKYGVNFLIDVFQNKRVINWTQSLGTLKKLIEISPLFFAFYLLIKEKKDFKNNLFITNFIVPFVCFSAVIGVIQASAEGVNYNCFFELLISLCISLGIYLKKFHYGQIKKNNFTILFLIIFPVFIFSVPVELVHSYHVIKNEKQENKIYSNLIGKIKINKGAVICEDLALCYWAHKNEIVDFFNTEQKIKIYKNTYYFHKVFEENSISLIEIRKSSLSNLIGIYIKKLGYNVYDSENDILFMRK